MSKRNAVIGTIVAVAILAAVPFAYADPGARRGPGGPGLGVFGRLQHLQEELNLSEAQIDQIRGIFAGLHTQNEAYRDQVRGGFHSVTETLIKNPNDVAAAQALLDRQFTAQRAIKSNMLAATSKALNVLTPEQRAELATMLEERSERRRSRSGRR